MSSSSVSEISGFHCVEYKDRSLLG